MRNELNLTNPSSGAFMKSCILGRTKARSLCPSEVRNSKRPREISDITATYIGHLYEAYMGNQLFPPNGLGASASCANASYESIGDPWRQRELYPQRGPYSEQEGRQDGNAETVNLNHWRKAFAPFTSPCQVDHNYSARSESLALGALVLEFGIIFNRLLHQ